MKVAEKLIAPQKTRAPILAAGGIVLRDAPEPLIAVVRLRKDKAWVLPKGKLKPGEDALAAAKREAMEETGHEVEVHEFLGAMSREAGKPKVVQFWRMHATDAPPRKLMRDVKAVKWLPLEQAVRTLTHAHERTFLAQMGPVALRAAGHAAPEAALASFAGRIRAWFQRLTHVRA
jgi:8-oxo-dGTP diphosphatase